MTSTPTSGPRAPVIAIDGPSASGKGTLAKRLADRLGFHYLDSGAIYRTLALAVADLKVDPTDEAAIAEIASGLDLTFSGDSVLLGNRDITEAIRDDSVGVTASTIAAMPSVRSALLARQRAFRRCPGLIADGRDMGSVVFVDASLKVFLTASVEVRAERRHKQLIQKGVCVSLAEVSRELADRDARDCDRAESPLCQQPDALLIDNSTQSVDDCVDRIVAVYLGRR